MRTESPWLTSAGESTRPNRTSQATPASVATPSTRVAGVAVVRTVGGVALAPGTRCSVVPVTRSPIRR